MKPEQILKKPIVTEKGQALAQRGKYLFSVAKEATKPQIAAAVEALYKGVEVGKVAIARAAGKKVFWRTPGGRQAGRRSAVKKAIVTLSKGEIKLFEKGGKE